VLIFVRAEFNYGCGSNEVFSVDASGRIAVCRIGRKAGVIDLKVIVFGATGRVGRAVALTLLTKGHQVTAFARDPAELPAREEISVIKGDAMDADAVARAVPGHDAIVVALGDPRNPVLLALGLKPLSSPDVCEVGTRNIIAAATAASVKRLICVTSYGVGDSRDKLPAMHQRIFRWLRLTGQMTDKENQEKLVKASNLDWTLVQPVGLTDGAATGRWLISTRGERRKRTISRVDLADVIVGTLEQARYLRETVVVSGLTITQSAEAA
jgi:putative NADH-flavin reductase